MRSKVLVILTAILLFGVSFAVYAYTSTSTTETVAASCCCCSHDSCPMKSKDGKAMAGHEMKAGEGHSCCGDSCPMKAKGEKGMAGHDMKMANGESCPMMKDGKAHEMHKGEMPKGEMHTGMKHDADGKSGCACACCAHGNKKTDTATI
ncbi:MAG: hypothetical protein AB7J13_04600 [Pyrinomonadaceae bacterium]